MLGGVQAQLNTKLVWRDAEDGFELPDEMKRRDPHLGGEIRYGRRGLALFSQQVARQTQASEPFVSQQHRWYQCNPRPLGSMSATMISRR
jgi:hypothetical protein